MPRHHHRGPRDFLTEEEKQNAPKVTKELLFRILSYLKPYWLSLCAVLVVIFLSAILGLLPSIITAKIIDQAILGKNLSLLFQLVLIAVLTLFASQVMGVLETYINAYISYQIIYDMKNEMFNHLQSMPHSFFTTEKQGDIITRMNSDISGVSTVVSNTLAQTISNLCVVITTIVALMKMNWQLALVGILIIPFLILPTKTAGKKRWTLASLAQEGIDELNDIINESLSVSGSLLIKLFTREQDQFELFKKTNRKVINLSIKEERAGQWFHVVMGIFTNLGPLLIYLAGGYFIIQLQIPNLTVGTITATVTLINRLYRPIQDLLNIGVDFTRSLALFSRIFSYLDKKPDITNCEHPIKPDLSHVDIHFMNVSFDYQDDIPLLRNLSFTIPDGKMYAIVGPSGAGKSSIVNLIPRLYDVKEGCIQLGNYNIKDIDLTYLRQNIGKVTQEAYLFNDTIKNNLLMGKKDATDEEIINACKIANIHDFIISQPKGYDTIVGNRGLKLSGGEKQRLSIARVILKSPCILILDEATSSLDSISESAIQNALDQLMKNRTSIVIAHRLSTILAADQILVVSNGSIVEQGSHEELIQKNGVYKKLYETQFRKVIDMETKKD